MRLRPSASAVRPSASAGRGQPCTAATASISTSAPGGPTFATCATVIAGGSGRPRPELVEGGETFLHVGAVHIKNGPLHDIRDLGASGLQTGPEVGQGLLGLLGHPSPDHGAVRADAVLPTDVDRVRPRRHPHSPAERGTGVQRLGIDVFHRRHQSTVTRYNGYMQLGSAPDLRRRFQSGRPCLDLVHTGGDGALARFEIVHSPDDLGRLLGVILETPRLAATRGDLAKMLRLRTALTRIAYQLAEGSSPIAVEAPRDSDIATVNAAAAAPPLVPALRPGGATVFVAPTVTACLSTLARDAIDLFGGPLASRIRVCAAENCGLLLVDTSKSGRRRWCSMEVCGNRAKVRAHRSRA